MSADTSDDSGARLFVQPRGGAEDLQGAMTVTVVSDTRGPDSLRLSLYLPGSPAEEAGEDGPALPVAIGEPITASGVHEGGTAREPLFAGRVYSVGIEDSVAGSKRFTAVAYDNSYLLYHGTHTRTYRDKTDVDIAKAIAREVGLKEGEFGSTGGGGGGELPKHVVLGQFNETHVDFLTRRGLEIGYVLRVDGDTLSFAPPPPASQAPPPGRQDDPQPRKHTISHGSTDRLTVRVSAAQLASRVEVRSWDHTTRKPIVASCPVENPYATAEGDDPQQAVSAFPESTYVVDSVPVADAAEAEQLARTVARRIGGRHVYAEGATSGDPRLLAGTPVAIDTPGSQFDRQVVLTRVVHRRDRNMVYTTEFVASGGRDRSLLGIIGDAQQQATGQGAVVATVTNVNDTEGLGRVKVSYPWQATDADGNLPETDWVRVVQPGAGAGGGLQVMPEVNDEVLVLFDQGDHRRPYVIGGLWNARADIPSPGLVDPDAGTVLGRLWRSRNGHEIVLLDKGPKDDQEKTFDGIVLRTGAPRQDGESGGSGKPKTSVAISLDAATGTLTVEVTGDVAVTGAKNITLAATESLTLDGGKKVTITGSEEISLN